MAERSAPDRLARVRITGGILGGRLLRVPHTDLRPTSDRVREAMFARLGDLSGAVVLDLFAGSGALGLEALSRGAAHVDFVEKARPAARCVRENLAALGLAERARVLPGDARSVLRALEREGARYDLVFVDPPYASGLAAELLAALGAGALLAEGACVVVESDRRRPPGDAPGLAQTDERRYGDTLLTRYRCAAEATGAAATRGEQAP
jgi:16S rRNA (guanine966-N2)-methyltransferase